MKMAANSNTGVPHGAVPASMFNDNAFLHPFGARNSSTGMILPVESSGGINSMTWMTPTENSGGNGMSDMAGLVPGGSSSSGLLLDTVPGLNQDTGMVVDWSFEEQSLLEEGLVK